MAWDYSGNAAIWRDDNDGRASFASIGSAPRSVGTGYAPVNGRFTPAAPSYEQIDAYLASPRGQSLGAGQWNDLQGMRQNAYNSRPATVAPEQTQPGASAAFLQMLPQLQRQYGNSTPAVSYGIAGNRAYVNGRIMDLPEGKDISWAQQQAEAQAGPERSPIARSIEFIDSLRKRGADDGTINALHTRVFGADPVTLQKRSDDQMKFAVDLQNRKLELEKGRVAGLDDTIKQYGGMFGGRGAAEVWAHYDPTAGMVDLPPTVIQGDLGPEEKKPGLKVPVSAQLMTTYRDTLNGRFGEGSFMTEGQRQQLLQHAEYEQALEQARRTNTGQSMPPTQGYHMGERRMMDEADMRDGARAASTIEALRRIERQRREDYFRKQPATNLFEDWAPSAP